MASPRFSVVIPTRERAETLRFSLQTCFDQNFDDYEIVVCDNHSSPATREVVESFPPGRVRYVRTDRPLSMSDNWELAVSRATGEYVTVLGDDDALLWHALKELDGLITRTGAKAIRWCVAFYTWPTVALEGEGDYLALPLARQIRTVDAADAIAAVASFRESYGTLPMLYNSVIHRDLISALRDKAGRVFLNNYPDVCSGFAFGHMAGTYLSSDLPMSVCGLSGRSNGVAALFLRRTSAVAEEFHRLNALTPLGPHPHVPDLPIFPAVPVADSFAHARDALFPGDDRLRLDRRLLADQCVAGLWAIDQDQWSTRMNVIRASLADDPELARWFEQSHGGAAFRPATPAKLRARGPGFDGTQLHLNADAFGVRDVAAAAKLCEQLLGVRGAPAAYDLPGPAWWHAEVERVRGELARTEGLLAASESQRAADRAAGKETAEALGRRAAAAESESASLRGEVAALRPRPSLARRLSRAPRKLFDLLKAAPRS